MPRETTIKGPAIPEAFAEMGYSTKEYVDHTITVRYKEEEIAALNQSAATPTEIINIIARHFVRTAVLASTHPFIPPFLAIGAGVVK